ncbi:hypothetical protein [Cylindrospermopsis raciborskii]|uniref:hypothetical protein n=1 Tax=Cylindrospermopsis raciborskii TaxID=77022 RepID=UPI002154F93C|nr:hypothetical protein [Cylindrospermopsis raciborskii]
MLDLDRILNQERLLRAMTGLNRQAFNELLSQFADTYERTVFNSFFDDHLMLVTAGLWNFYLDAA